MIERLSWEAYRAIKAEHATHLRAMLLSPLHYHDLELHPREDRACLSLGVHAHAMTLEPGIVADSVRIWTGKTRAGTKWQEFLDDAVAAGKRVVTTKEHDAAKRVAEAVRANPLASILLRQGEAELSLIWSEFGQTCKGRIDWLTRRTPGMPSWIACPDGHPIAVGLKTSADPTERPFRTAAERYGYVLQWGMYARGYEMCADVRPFTVEIVVGSARPHEVFVYPVPDEVIDDGITQYVQALQQVATCRASGRWPGRGDEQPIVFRRADWAVEPTDDPGLDLTGMEAA